MLCVCVLGGEGRSMMFASTIVDIYIFKFSVALRHSPGAVWESRWPSWAVRPNEPSGFRGRKDLLNRASALVTTCPWYHNWHLRTLSNTTYLPSSTSTETIRLLGTGSRGRPPRLSRSSMLAKILYSTSNYRRPCMRAVTVTVRPVSVNHVRHLKDIAPVSKVLLSIEFV